MAKTGIIGAGSWGIALSLLLSKNGHEVSVWSALPEEIRERYALEGAEPLRAEEESCAALGVKLVRSPVSTVEKGYVRHDPDLLARALIALHSRRRVRIAGGGYREEP